VPACKQTKGVEPKNPGGFNVHWERRSKTSAFGGAKTRRKRLFEKGDSNGTGAAPYRSRTVKSRQEKKGTDEAEYQTCWVTKKTTYKYGFLGTNRRNLQKFYLYTFSGKKVLFTPFSTIYIEKRTHAPQPAPWCIGIVQPKNGGDSPFRLTN